MKNEKEEPKSKPKYNMWQNTCFMVKLAWTTKEKKVLVLSLLSAALAVATNLINLYVSPGILSAVEAKVPMQKLLVTILLFTLGIMFLSAASAYVDSNTMFGRITVRGELVSLLNRKAATTSYPNMEDDRFDKLLSKTREVVSSNQASGEAIWATLTSLLTNILGFLIYVSLLTSVQPVLILIILATTVTSYFVSNYVNGYSYRHREEEADILRKISYLSSRAGDRTAAKDVLLFGLRFWLKELYDKALDAYMAFHRKAQNIYIWAKIADIVLTFLRSGVAYAYLIHLVLAGGLTVSQFLLYFTAVSGFTGWVTGILSKFNTLHRQSLDISIVRECLEYPEPFRFEEGEALPTEDKAYEIRLENVSFRYPGAEKDTLSNINLVLHPGEKLAVVGRNGAGKTTLIKLICGFYDPTQGRILLNGRDIRDFNRRDYYRLFSAVFQDFSLLAGTVAVNVAQDETEIDMEKVKNCLEKAGLDKKIASLPNVCDTFLNRFVYEDAAEFSGGETQRLMLARALYKDSPFLILDEPTAALDPIAESKIYRKYNEMTIGKSSVYISHRLASTRFCDRIILIEDTGIREEGTHEELLKIDGEYARLYEIQSKYYQEEEK